MSEDSEPTVTGVTTGGEHPAASVASAETVPASLHAATADRTRIGRYKIVRRLGAGGMGVVWEATDPELGRNVAIKLMHDGVARLRLAERLRREAQALAKLDHPNVVTVYDVGLDDGELYIVMQLVAGTTLDRAIAGCAPRDRIALLVQAGRGLAAAHAAGIVHRDFKPTNVLVDARGHVRVTDFGLARASHASDEAPEPPAGEALAADGARGQTLTRGELVGTPAYMAPEQLLGGPVTHATDQFAFCVTSWEALAGERPYAGGSVAELRDAVLGGRRRELPAGVARRIRALLVRGLAIEPKDRFASMTELLDELSPERRRVWIAGGVGVAALATTAILLGVTRPAGDPCRGVEQPIESVWTERERAAVRAGLGDLAPAVIATLDDRTARWRAGRLEACQASHVPKDPQTLDERDARYACLDRSLVDERAAIRVLVHAAEAGKPDPVLRRHAFEVAGGGRDPGECTRHYAGERLRAGPRKEADAALAGEVANAIATQAAGRNAEMLKLRAELEPRVVAAGEHELIADWFFAVGEALAEVGDKAHAREPMRRAAEAAIAARHDEVAAHAWAELAIMSAEASDLEGADNLLVAARGAAARANNPPVAGVWIDIAEGRVALERGAFTAAIAKCGHAGDVARELGVEPRFVIDTLACLHDAQLGARDGAGAVATARRELDAVIAIWGEDGTPALEARRSLAVSLAMVGDDAGAQAAWDLTLAGYERVFGPDSVQMMATLRDFAVAQTPAGASSTPKARVAIRRAVAIGERRLPATSGELAGVLESLAYVEGALHDLDASTNAYERAIQIYEKLDDPAALARALYNCADGLKEAKHCDRALPLLERAARVAASTGQKSAIEAGALYGRGTCLGADQRWAEAEPALRLSIDQFDKLEQPLFAAQSRWELADQLVKRGKRADGLRLAQEAADQLAGKQPPAPALRAQILDWIKHP